MNHTDDNISISDTILDSIADILPNAASVHKYLDINSDTILNGIADGVVVIGLDRKILFVNRAARKLLGKVGADAAVRDGICSETIGHSGCFSDCLIDSTIKTGEPLHNYEVSLENAGKRMILSLNTALLRDRGGNVIGAIEILRDITLLKELKNRLNTRYSFDNIIGKNHRMREVFDLLSEVAPTRAAVLIEGETGTGKELVANAIHHNSPRSGGPFIKVNCAALAEGLLESELFGHVKGAFTGAIADKAGRFELADGGTIFLDEVGDIGVHTQTKLLRVLQDGEFERVGGSKTLRVNVRVVAATNKDLKTAVEKGELREDLYYRLKVVPIHLPPLRERKDDIPLLVRYFIDKFNKEMGMDITNVSPAAMDLLLEYNYPGNIRELEHIIEHAFVRCHQETTINLGHLPKDLRDNDIMSRVINDSEPLKAFEKEMILQVLTETGWRYNECARKLKMSRTTLWRKMRKFNIEKK